MNFKNAHPELRIKTRKRASKLWLAAVVGPGLALLCFWLISSEFRLIASSEQSSSNQPQADSQSWREARTGYEFTFPRDHAAHNPYRIEWWYYTGNLETRSGRRFGYQLTFFRFGIMAEPINPSRWAVRDLHMAHFAISDIEGKRFHFFERFNRAGVGWAGASSSDYRVWNEDWEARLEGSDHLLKASDGEFAAVLRLAPSKDVVIHGENELSQKGAAAGNASHYYSITRFNTVGRIVVGGEAFEVTGLSWMDHEFGTSFLEKEQVGWDWFSIQLDDGRDLMLFQIRRADGSIDPRSSGTMIEADGRATHIPSGQFTLTQGETWKSEASGAGYPIKWTLDLPGYGLRLNVAAAFDSQELRTAESTGVTYWEGSIKVEGSSGNGKVQGRGYLEMTGYAGQSMGSILH